MDKSLSAKIRAVNKSVPRMLWMTSEQIRTISRQMPRTEGELARILSLKQMEILCGTVLNITRLHPRDQSNFEECVRIVRVFVDGGHSGVCRLNEVFSNILKHHHVVECDRLEILLAADAHWNAETGRITY